MDIDYFIKLQAMDPNQKGVSFTVGTLNFSATMISPYEFHEQQKEDKHQFSFKFDDAFRHYALKSFPNFDEKNFDWGIAAMDLVWKNRFSPLYQLQCGVGPHGKLMNETQFLNHWNKQSEKIKSKIIREGVERQIKKGAKLSKQEITHNLQNQLILCREFDLISYKALVKVLYGVEDIKHLDVSSQKYLSERKKHFNKSYLNEKQKKQITIQMIENRGYDIFCLQQVDHAFINQLKQKLPSYLVVEMPHKLSEVCQSIILLRKTKFPNYTLEKVEKERDEFLTEFAQFIKNPASFSKKFSTQTINFLQEKTEQQIKQYANDTNPVMRVHRELFWNNDTCYAVVGPLIIFSPHISTKVNLNEEQINAIKKVITKLITYFPEKHFICAGDLNGQFQNQINFETPDKKYIKVNVFPYHSDDVTCYKMRTMTQTQKRKALAVSFCKKDYIITDLRIDEQAVVMADGTPITKHNAPLIPNDKHPFDHFIVAAQIKMVQRIQSVSPLRKKKPVSSPWQGYNLEFADRIA